MTSTAEWTQLSRRKRRRELVVTTVSVAVTWAILVAVYYLIPFADRTTGASLVRLAAAIVLFAVVLAWQLRRVLRADRPGLRAVQALGGIIPLFLLTFAGFYLSLSEASATSFSEPLDHTGALYLAVTVFSTVGFGDITPSGDIARIATMIQMLLDLVVIGVVVRLLTTAAKSVGDGTRSPAVDDG